MKTAYGSNRIRGSSVVKRPVQHRLSSCAKIRVQFFLPKQDPRRSGNRKWQCTWPMCNRAPMSSQGECRAHVLSHRTVRSSPICTCAKATFANAKTLATHRRRIHNVDLDELRRAPPSNVIEDPARPLCH